MRRRLYISLSTVLVLVACGGGAVSPPPPPPLPPPPSSPQFTSTGSLSVAENTPDTGYTATATDSDGDSLSFSIIDGSDQSSFHIDSNSGVLSFVGAPDFESPVDSNSDNTYEVQLRVTDSDANTDALIVTITVIDANDPPVVTSSSMEEVRQNASGAAYTAVATDEDGHVVMFSLTGGVDVGLFTMDTATGELTFVSVPNFENPLDSDANNVYVVEITADDGNGGLSVLNLQLTVIGRLGVEVLYPTGNADVGDQTGTVFVTGRVRDLDDGTVSGTDVSEVLANGIVANISSTDPFLWSAQVPVQSGPNQLTVEANSLGVLAGKKDQTITSSFAIPSPAGIAYDSGQQLALVTDDQAAALFSLNLVTGVRTLIVRNVAGMAPVFSFPAAVAIDNANNRALLVDEGLSALLAVTLSDGSVSVVSDSTTTDTMFDNPRGLFLDSSNSRALVLDLGIRALLEIDLATGARGIVSGSGVGTGIDFSFPNDVVLNESGDRAFVVDIDLKSVISVNLLNGNRTILSDVNTGGGTLFDVPSDVSFDAANNQLLVLDEGLDGLIGVDPSSGDRVVIADDNSVGTLISEATDVVWIADTNDALILNRLPGQVLAVDLDTGIQRLVSVARVGNGDGFVNPIAVALDLSRNRALVADTGQGTLLSVDLDDASRSPIANSEVISSYRALVFDTLNDRALVLDAGGGGTLFSIDFLSGERRILSDALIGSGPAMSNPFGIALDPSNPNIAFVVDMDTDSLLMVNLTTGSRVEISGINVGPGPGFNNPIDVAVDRANNRAIVLDFSSQSGVESPRLFSVDLADGARAIISGDSIGTGAGLLDPTSMSLNLDTNTAYVTDTNGIVTAINLATGDRTEIATGTSGSGPKLVSPLGITVDSSGNRAFMVDNVLRAMFIIELGSLERAIASQ